MLAKKKYNINKISLILAIISLVLFPLPSELGIAVSHAENTSYSQFIKNNNTIRIDRTKKIINVRITAYSSTPDQCDSSPFITASGTHVHDGTIAANCLPFGTKVRFPKLFGNKIFTVEDRLSTKYGCKTIDIWFNSRANAMQFGSAYSLMEIL